MEKIFIERVHVEKDMSLKDLATLLQEGANHQLSPGNLGEIGLWEKGLAWVIVRRELKIERLPKAGEDIYLKTWAGRGRHGLYPRWFEVGTTSPMLWANCQWTVIDMNAREMLFNDDMFEGAPYCDKCDEGPKIKIAHHFPELSKVEHVDVTEEMIDGNHHVNNSFYLKWMEKLYRDIASSNNDFTEFPPYIWIEYSREILPGADVSLRWEMEDTEKKMDSKENSQNEKGDELGINKPRKIFVKGFTGDECHFSAVMEY